MENGKKQFVDGAAVLAFVRSIDWVIVYTDSRLIDGSNDWLIDWLIGFLSFLQELDENDLDLEDITERLRNESLTLCHGTTALPPFTLKRIIEEFDDTTMEYEEENSDPFVEPIIHGKVVPRYAEF